MSDYLVTAGVVSNLRIMGPTQQTLLNNQLQSFIEVKQQWACSIPRWMTT